MLAQPIKVDTPRVVTAYGHWLYVAGLAISAEKPADGRSTDAEQGCRFLVVPRETRGIGFDDSSAKFDGNHPHLRSNIRDLFKVGAV
jgi:hypothetical protein